VAIWFVFHNSCDHIDGTRVGLKQWSRDPFEEVTNKFCGGSFEEGMRSDFDLQGLSYNGIIFDLIALHEKWKIKLM